CWLTQTAAVRREALGESKDECGSLAIRRPNASHAASAASDLPRRKVELETQSGSYLIDSVKLRRSRPRGGIAVEHGFEMINGLASHLRKPTDADSLG